MQFDCGWVFGRLATIVVTTLAGFFAPLPHDVQDVSLATGVRLRVVQQGPQDGPVVLLLHGYSDSSFSFSRVLPLLPGNVRVIVPDQRGHGDSERPAGGYTIDDFAGDALALMDALDVARATVVGHSMGSFVARRIAERAPERVTRLVLVGGAAMARNAVLAELESEVQGLTDPVDPAFVRSFQLSTVHRAVPEEFMAHAISESQKVPARVWKAAMAGLLAYTPTSAPPALPTVVLGGEQDAVFTPAEQEALAQSIPGASVQIVPGIGHSFHWEAPEQLAAILSERRGKLRRRPSSALETVVTIGVPSPADSPQARP